MKKVEKIHTMLMKRLPKHYSAPIKIYSNSKSMFLALCKNEKTSYSNLIKDYQNYIKNLNQNKQGYIKTKYYKPLVKNKKTEFKTHNDFSAFGGTPIMLANDKIKKLKEHEIAFLLLHEIGHNVIDLWNERSADTFAIRWTRKLIKEKLIKEKLIKYKE